MESEKAKEIKKALEERTQHKPINCSHSEYVEACGMYCRHWREFVADMGIKNGQTCENCNEFNATDKVKEYADILTLINELESENDTLHTNLCEWRKENQQLKDRIENQRMTKKGFRYEILPSTEYSPRRVKDYNEYCTLYNRLAELEDKIENGTLKEVEQTIR